MTGRILRLELRRSTAPWIALLIVVLGAAMIYFTSGRHGLWMGLATTQRSMLALLWPLALGAGAWQAARERRSRMIELIATTARPRWRRVLPTATALAIGGVLGYLGMFTAGAGYVLPVATYLPAGAVPTVLIGALFMVIGLWLGLAIGSYLPSALTPPLLVVASAAVLVFVFNRLIHGGDPAGSVLFLPVLQVTNGFLPEFVTLSARTHAAQVVWLVGLAAAALLAFAPAARRVRILALVPALAGAALAAPLQPPVLSASFTYDRAAVALVCTPDRPRVCVTRAHETALADLRDPAHEALRIMAAKLPDAPTSVVEDYHNQVTDPSYQPPPDTVAIRLEVTPSGRALLPARVILFDVLDGAGTPGCYVTSRRPTEFDRRYYSARLAAAAWLLGSMPDSPPAFDLSLAQQAFTTLRGLPAGEQRARVAALRQAELACDDRDRLDILVGAR